MANQQDIPAVPDRTQPTIEFINGTPGKSTIAVGEHSDSFVRIGLWDGAFGRSSKYGNKVLFDGTSAEMNFIDSDSRRFYIRVVDGAAGTDTIEVKWRALTESGAALDDPEKERGDARGSVITLVREGGSPIFLSRGLMLVSEPSDRVAAQARVPNDTGGPRSWGMSDYRIRLASMRGSVEVEYKGRSARASVFRRAPDERRRCLVHVCCPKRTGSGDLAVGRGANSRVWSELRQARMVYERVGIWLETVVGANAAEVLRGPDNLVAEVFDPIDRTSREQPRLSLSDVNEIVLSKMKGMVAPVPHAVVVFLVDTIHPSIPAVGIAFPDAQRYHRGYAAVAYQPRPDNGASASQFTLAHEIGHIIMDVPGAKDPNSGRALCHFDEGYYPEDSRLRDHYNLMKDGTRDDGPPHATSKRIWDAPDAYGRNFFSALRQSRHLLPL
jgi:hypothetical protein